MTPEQIAREIVEGYLADGGIIKPPRKGSKLEKRIESYIWLVLHMVDEALTFSGTDEWDQSFSPGTSIELFISHVFRPKLNLLLQDKKIRLYKKECKDNELFRLLEKSGKKISRLKSK
jgi:hypothetical protein